MLTESDIRTIAARANSAIPNANSNERQMIIENAIREAILKSQRQCLEPNAGCL